MYKSYSELYKQKYDKNPLIDFRKFESYMSIVISSILTILLYYIIFIEKTNLTKELANLVSGVAFSYITSLGFIISGIAIVSGTLSTKVVEKIDKKGLYNELINLLTSFWYIGMVIGINVGVMFCILFILYTKLPFLIFLVIPISLLSIYNLFFILFYMISLLGTCIHIFQINYKYSDKVKETP